MLFRSIPSFDITQAVTQVLIRSGETIAIGGLLSDTTQLSENKVPYLADVPVLGKIFRSKRQTSGSGNTKTETLFFVTVTMVDSEGQPAGDRMQKTPQAAGSADKDSQDEPDTASDNPKATVDSAGQVLPPA